MLAHGEVRVVLGRESPAETSRHDCVGRSSQYTLQELDGGELGLVEKLLGLGRRGSHEVKRFGGYRRLLLGVRSATRPSPRGFFYHRGKISKNKRVGTASSGTPSFPSDSYFDTRGGLRLGWVMKGHLPLA